MNHSIIPMQIHMDFGDQYKNNNAAKLIDLYITGSGSQLKGHVLLPQNALSVAVVTPNNTSLPGKIVIIENAKYVDFKVPLQAVQSLAIRYRYLNKPSRLK